MDGMFPLDKNYINSDDGFPEQKQINPALIQAILSSVPDAQNHAVYNDYGGILASPRAEYSSGGREAIQNADIYDALGDYNRFFTQDALNNQMSGPDANALYYANVAPQDNDKARYAQALAQMVQNLNLQK